MTNPTAGPQTSSSPAGQDTYAETEPGHLAWLLEDFLVRMIGTQAAVLLSPDGLQMAAAGLSEEEADSAAALVSGLYSLSKAIGLIPTPVPGAPRLGMIQHDGRQLYFMNTADLKHNAKAATEVMAGDGTVGAVLGVFAEPDADPGPISYQMEAVIGSVADHLRASTRSDGSAAGESPQP